MILGGYMQMSDINLFWPIYRKIEKEVLDIATYVHIDDTQLKVYSIHIGELIVRCVTEIEAISKRLYEILGGNMNPIDDDGRTRSLYFDTDCLALIENRWKLSTKEIVIENEYFYIENEENKKLIPLKKAHIRSGASWNKAYQAIKHNRFYNLNKATIKNLLDALGALYILNVYYKDEVKKIGRYVDEIDDHYGSEIFLVHIYQATQMDVKSKMDDTCIIDFNEQEYEKSIVLIKYDDESFSKIHNAYINDCKATRERILGRKEVQAFLEENPDINTDSIKAICQQMGKNSLISECQCLNALGQIERMNEKRAELVLNKNTSIYPECIANEGDNPEDILEVNIS